MIDIVIINWNSGNYLNKCVQSLFASDRPEIIKQVFIIDNNSSDLSIEKIEKNDKILVIQNPSNNGFSKACNQGFKLCSSPYTLLLNPDTQLFDTTLADCISFMNMNERIDILGCQLVNDNGAITHSCARFPSPLRYFFDAIGLSKTAPGIFHPALLMMDWNHKESKVVDQVMGAFMFMRTSIFEKIGFFDERYFVYYEELDFSTRLAESGGISYYNSDIKAIHSGEGTTYGVKAFRLFLNLKSRLQYAKKHFSFSGYCLVWTCTFIIEPVTRSILLALKGNVREIKNVFKAYFLLLNNRGAKIPS
jgi:N-acetylglucosaminyl-diphospho-decaprenol L-rhamnosyltransferase